MTTNPAPPRIAVITCAVLEEEVAHLGSRYPHIRSVEILPQGLHEDPDRLREELQARIDAVEASCPEADTIVLGYGLCCRGTEGVRTRRCRLVIARAHDCITHLLGSRRRYAEYVERHPGTYWYSPGWNRHHLPPGEERHRALQEDYTERFGEDNAAYLMETEQGWFRTYDRATFVDLGVGDVAADLGYTRECADWLGWQFDRRRGDPQLVIDLLSGSWDEDRFLVLPPGRTFRMTGDDRVIDRVAE